MLGFFLILESRFSIYRYQSTYSILQLTFYFKKNLPKSTLIPEKFKEQKIFGTQFKDGGLYFFVDGLVSCFLTCF